MQQNCYYSFPNFFSKRNVSFRFQILWNQNNNIENFTQTETEHFTVFQKSYVAYQNLKSYHLVHVYLMYSRTEASQSYLKFLKIKQKMFGFVPKKFSIGSKLSWLKVIIIFKKDRWSFFKETKEKKRNVSIVEDRRIDITTPGFSASYCFFTVVEAKTKKILDFYVAEKSMAEYSAKLEPVAAKVLLARLHNRVNIKVFTTDRSNMIKKMMQEVNKVSLIVMSMIFFGKLGKYSSDLRHI